MSLFKTQPSVKEFYLQNKDEIRKLVASEHFANPDLSKAQLALTTSEGINYYTYGEELDLPLSRYSRLCEYMELLEKGVSATDQDLIFDGMTEALAHIYAGSPETKTKAKVLGTLLEELKRRRTEHTPYFVMINLVSLMLIRQDENPTLFSFAIHDIKCDEIQKEIELGNTAFFLAVPQLKNISVFSQLSTDQLPGYLSHLQKEANLAKKRLQYLLSQKGTSVIKKTSKTVS